MQETTGAEQLEALSARQRELCQAGASEELIGRGASISLCERRPTFYELCSGLRRTVTKETGGNDKCLLSDEWARDNPQMLYTARGPLHHYHSGHSYERLYPVYLSGLRDRSVRLMEIGSFRGDSLRLWWSYFDVPSTFVLVDLKPQWDTIDQVANDLRRQHKGRRHNWTLLKADQGNTTALRAVARQARAFVPYPSGSQGAGSFDVIVDDGSHFCEHIIRSFEQLFPLLVPGVSYSHLLHRAHSQNLPHCYRIAARLPRRVFTSSRI